MEPNKEYFRQEYYKIYFNFNENNIQEGVNDICKKYVEGLYFVN